MAGYDTVHGDHWLVTSDSRTCSIIQTDILKNTFPDNFVEASYVLCVAIWSNIVLANGCRLSGLGGGGGQLPTIAS
jgi:hypothetical protein